MAAFQVRAQAAAHRVQEHQLPLQGPVPFADGFTGLPIQGYRTTMMTADIRGTFSPFLK